MRRTPIGHRMRSSSFRERGPTTIARVSPQGGLDLLINDPANQINNPTSVDRVCVPSRGQTPIPFFFRYGSCPQFPPPPVLPPPLWTLKKTWFIFGPRQSSSIRPFLTARLTFPRPKSSARSGAILKKSSSLSSSALKKLRGENEARGEQGRGERRRAESRRKTHLPCGVTLEWQLEGLMIPSRESHRESLPPRSLEYCNVAGAPPVGRKSSRLDRARGVASTFINQCYVRLASTWRDGCSSACLPGRRLVLQACNVVNAFGRTIISVVINRRESRLLCR